MKKQIVVAWYEKDCNGEVLTEHNDTGFFASRMDVVSPEEYDIAKRHPSQIVLQFPYDDTSPEIGIDPRFLSYRLRDLTDRLVYVPCFDPDPPEPDDYAGQQTMRFLVEQPAVAFSDCVVVSSEAMRTAYIDALCDITGKDRRPMWEQRVCSSLRCGFSGHSKK